MIRCKIVNLLTLFILTDLNRSAITQITSQPSSSVFTSSKLKIFPTPQSSNPLTDISIQTKFSDKNQNDQSIKFNKEITYTIVEESNVPQLIGDLINDFNLNKYLLRHVLNEPRQSPMHTSNNQNNQSKQMLSIDLIANHYQSTQYTDADLPRLHLFPSNQWSAEYFHINYHNLFKQELIQIKRLDRDRLCQLNDFNKTTEHQKNQQQLKHYDTCMCSSDICSTIYSQKLKSSALSLLTRVETLNGRGKIESGELALLLPYCQFIMTLAINLFHTGMEIFTIRIKLLDLNDNYPSFKPFTKYEVHFMEDDRIGVRRRLPLATDVDMCLHSEITYRLEAGESFKDEGDLISENVGSLHNNNRPVNLSNLFSLKLTETSNTKVLEIQLEHTLDREKRDKYDLYLLAIDDNSNFHRREENRHTTTLPIIVYIQDVNDCKPEFLVMNGSHYTPAKLSEPVFNEVAENVAVGYIITKFQAIDEDFGDNGRISYEMGQYTHSITKSVSSELVDV
ncbi:unnamed protein product [Trichobilharzia regenti]|nr:unnamed protein product [Trichobilharzia regenti]